MARKKRQLQIVGTERKTISEIDEAAEAYREVRDQRMALTKQEGEKQAALVEVLKKHKVTEYKFDDDDGDELTVILDVKEKARVKKSKDDDSDDSDA